MKIDHVAIWTNNLEKIKNYYIRYFGAITTEKYVNEKSKFESYFLAFDSGIKLEIMTMVGVPGNLNDTITNQHIGFIHLAFGANTVEEVKGKAIQLQADGFQIIEGQGLPVMVILNL